MTGIERLPRKSLKRSTEMMDCSRHLAFRNPMNYERSIVASAPQAVEKRQEFHNPFSSGAHRAVSPPALGMHQHGISHKEIGGVGQSFAVAVWCIQRREVRGI